MSMYKGGINYKSDKAVINDKNTDIKKKSSFKNENIGKYENYTKHFLNGNKIFNYNYPTDIHKKESQKNQMENIASNKGIANNQAKNIFNNHNIHHNNNNLKNPHIKTNNIFNCVNNFQNGNNKPLKIETNKNVNNNKINNNKCITQNNNNNFNNQLNISFNSYNNSPLVVLINCGNTTYMNVNIQCLANISNFSSFILKNLDLINKSQKDVPVLHFYSRIIYHLFPKPKEFKNEYSLENFHKIITYLNPIFRGKSTKNAIDFLIYLIDKLNEDMRFLINSYNNNNKNKQEIKTDFKDINSYLKYLITNHENENIIFQTFSWINKKVERCWECHNETTTFSTYYTYDLDLENALNKTIMNHKKQITIDDCIKYTSEKRDIYNIFCNICDKKTNIESKSTICVSKSVLIFLFRDLEKTENINKLNNNKIHIKLEDKIDLSQFVENKNNSFKKYTIHALILYDTQKREYIAYCFSLNHGKWYKYLNGSIEQACLSDFIGNVYDNKLYPVILFYRHL